MSAMKAAWHDLEAKGHALIAQLEEKDHVLAADFRNWFGKLTGHLPAVEAEVKADAEKVAHDAVEAEKPVANETMQDVAAVTSDAVAGVTEPAPATPPAGS